MSSPKVTIKEMITKWKDLTNQSDTVRWDEMEAFFIELTEEGYTPAEVMKQKENIFRVWCPMNWTEAQKIHIDWTNKAWFEIRRKGTQRTWDAHYSRFSKAWKASQQTVSKPQHQRPTLKVVGENFQQPSSFEEEYYSQFEILNDEQMLEHRKKMDKRDRNGDSK